MPEKPGNFWKTQRKRLKLSQVEMARAAGKSHGAVGAWELDKYAPKLSDAEALATAYQVSVERIEREIVATSRRMSQAEAVQA